MNMEQFEIEKAIRQVRHGPTTMRYICLICKSYLNEWDVKAGKAVCWKCRKAIWPKPTVEEKTSEVKQPRLVQIKDGLYAIGIG